MFTLPRLRCLWQRNLTNNFKFKNCLFGTTSVVKNSDKEKWVFSGYGITCDSAGLWSFDNDTARNVIIFGVDNSSSTHADNLTRITDKNNFLVPDEGPFFGINGDFRSPEKVFSIKFSNANTTFCLSLYYNAGNSFLFVIGKKPLNLKPTIKVLTSQLKFVSEAYLIDLTLLNLEKYL